jgi:NAD+ kinase
VFSPWVPGAQELADILAHRLSQLGESWVCPLTELEGHRQELSGLRFLATVGGDGTILRAVRVTAPLEVPLVGVNLGRLGFMAELSAEEAPEGIGAYLQDGTWLEKRTMLQTQILPGGEAAAATHGLNEAVVGRAQVAQLVHVEIRVDDQPLATYAGDGVIVATATGSTGYSLSAGGPILYPESPSLLVKPVAPQLSLGAALLLPPEAVVTMTVVRADHPASLSVDGYMDTPLAAGSAVRVQRSPYVARFLRTGPRPYFPQTLAQRLSSPVRETS